MGRGTCDPEIAVSSDPRALSTSTHSLFASFLPQQLRQQEAAAAETEEKEEMEIAEGKWVTNKTGRVAGKGRTGLVLVPEHPCCSWRLLRYSQHIVCPPAGLILGNVGLVWAVLG